MDTITHGIAGSVLARTLTRRSEARTAFLLGCVAAMVPDLDFLFLSSRLDYLRNHRGWTHSFVLLPFLALGLALLARLVFRGAPLYNLWLFAAVAIASHILCDWITSFGTMFFTPFSRTRYSLDWVFILDPVFTGIALVSLLAAALSGERGRAVSAAGAALLCVYVAFCAALHARALEAWNRMDRPPAGARVAALPQFLSPFRWLGLSEHDGEIHVAFFDIGPFARGAENPRTPTRFSEIFASLSDFYPPPERARILRFRKAPESAWLAAARALPDVQIYLAFARFPLETFEPTPDGGATITWEDLRFLPWFAGPWGSDGSGRFRREPFVYRIRLDAAGRPVERAFVRSSRFH
jgi:inner membrane protein